MAVSASTFPTATSFYTSTPTSEQVSGDCLPLIVVGGWGVNAAMLRPLVANWHSTIHFVSLDDALLAGCASVQEAAQYLVRRYPEPAIWLGWSQGAQVAMAACDSPGSPVQALVTLAGFPQFVADDQWRSGLPPETFDQFQQGLSVDANRTWRRFQQLLIHGCGQDEQQAARRALSSWMAEGPVASPAQLARGLDWLARENQRSAWTQLALPTLHLLGNRDALVSPWNESLTLPGSARCQVVEGMTHWPQGQSAIECEQTIMAFARALKPARETV